MSTGPASFKFERISLESGLSQSIVACILQDSRGFLWFGTEDGLNFYDGYDFRIFRHLPDDPSSISHNDVQSLYQSRDGYIWIGTFHGGLNRFDPRTDTITRYLHDPQSENSLGNNVVRAIQEDRYGQIWLGTENGLDRYDPSKQTFVHYRYERDKPNSLGNNWVRCLLEDREGNLWVGTDGGGLHRFDRSTDSFTVYRLHPKETTVLPADQIYAIHEDQEGNVWIGTNGAGPFRLDRRTGEFHPLSSLVQTPSWMSTARVYALHSDPEGNLWVGTDGNGLLFWDRAAKRAESLQLDPQNPQSLSRNEIRTIRQDRSGVLWVGTYGGGINKITKRWFNHYRSNPQDGNSLNNNIVWSIHEEESGVLWIGTHGGGLNRFDRKTNRYTHYRHRSGDPKSLSSDYVRLVYADSTGMLWIGTNGGGLNRFDRQKQEFTAYRHDPGNPDSISHNDIRSILEDRQGYLWIGTHEGGLNRLDRKTGKFTRYRHDEKDPNSLGNDVIRCIFQDHAGVLWLSAYGSGLERFDPSTGRFFHYRAGAGSKNGLSNNYLFALHEDRHHNLWIATWGGGLNRLNPERNAFLHFDVNDGLPSNSIYGILEDERGFLWLSTVNGLSRFDPEKKIFKNFTEQDGLQSKEFNGGSFFRSRTGEMFFGGINGFNSFFPSDIQDNRYQPPIVLTAFRMLNKKVKLDPPISETKELTLSYRDYFFSFEFAALDFTSPEKNQYAYRLRGLDPDWITTDADTRLAVYTNLQPGEYLFQVKASNNDGLWNETGTSLRLRITPPFWKTKWFLLSALAALFGLLFWVHHRRTIRITERLEKLRLENELKWKADFTAMLVHDLRAPLNAVMGYAEILKSRPDAAGIERICGIVVVSCEKMLGLINDMLDFAKFEAGKMTICRKDVAILPLLSDAVDLLNPLFQQRQVEVFCDFMDEMALTVLSADQDKILQVMGNLLSNAVKFSPKNGKIRVAARFVDSGQVEISVEDRGAGVPQEQRQFLFQCFSQLNADKKIKGTGLGLAVAKHIVEMHGGTIGYRDPESGSGSVFYFTLPCPAAGGKKD